MQIKQFPLPNKYMITPNCNDENNFINKLEFHLSQGIQLIQLRSENICFNFLVVNTIMKTNWRK